MKTAIIPPDKWMQRLILLGFSPILCLLLWLGLTSVKPPEYDYPSPTLPPIVFASHNTTAAQKAAVRLTSGMTAEQRQDAATIPYLANFLVGGDPNKREVAIQTLQRVGVVNVTAECIDELNSPDEAVRRRAANALSIITNTYFSYSSSDNPERHAEFIAKWHDWFFEHRAQLAKNRYSAPASKQ